MIDKERIEILEKAKRDISNNVGTFICSALEYHTNIKQLIKAKDTQVDPAIIKAFRVFPELKKHKPRYCSLYCSWFGGNEGKYIRIKVLNSMITEIKANSND